ncbi:MAG TPA: AMP-binding protein [Microthrixaceae bacterium]|nr:AMP-binding protein [Microthrixaceae bacterium]
MIDRSLLELLDGDDDAPAVYSQGVELSRGDLRWGASAVADELRAAGVEAGHAVAVQLPNGADLIGTLFGVWMAGGVYVPLNPRATATEVDHVVGAVRPRMIVRGDGIVPVDGEATVHDADVALISFTSGTTGAPKPVEQRHSGLLANYDSVLGGLLGDSAKGVGERTAPMPNLVPLSLSLWAGIYNVLFAFRVGAAVVLMERFEPREFARLVKEFAIRSTVLPPAAMVMLADDETVTSLEPLKYVRSITAPLSPLQARRFRDRFGVMLMNCYGQTEMGGEVVGWNAAAAREFGDSHLGAAGRANPGVDLEIRDDAGQAAPVGEEGELWVRTPAIALAIEAGTATPDRVDAEGWLRSGDIARIDAEGFLWIDGRVSDMINRGGMKVHPGEVEEVLRLSPSVDDVAVVGTIDDRLGEVPWAFVVAPDGLDEAELAALCREHLAPYKVPARFVAVDELPRNDVGKLLRRELMSIAELDL